MLLKIPMRLVHLLVHLLVHFYNFICGSSLLFKAGNQSINLYTNLYTCMVVVFNLYTMLYTYGKSYLDKVVGKYEAIFAIGTKDARNTGS